MLKALLRRLASPVLWQRLRSRWWQLKEAAALDHSAIQWPWFRRPSSPDFQKSYDEAIRQDWRRLRSAEARLVAAALSVGWPLAAAWQIARGLGRHGRWVERHHGIALTTQALQALRLAVRYNCPPASYYKFRLFDARDPGAMSFEYVHHYQICSLLGRLNDGAPIERLNDKVRFSAAAAEHGLKAAPVLVSFRRRSLERWHIDPAQLPNRDLVLKARDLSCGSWFERWDCTRAGAWTRNGMTCDQDALIAYALERSADHGVFLQERLSNHPDLSGLAGEGLSTLRVVTSRDESGKVVPVMSCFRMPCGRSKVDNFAAGGLAAPVDLATGTLGVAVAKLAYRGEFSVHPDSGQPISGVRLPNWHECLELVTAAHQRLTTIAFVGWDVVPTADGPLLLEANTTWCVDLLQIPNRKPIGQLVFPRYARDSVARAHRPVGLTAQPS